ncbi:DUF4287 domain-containing protein [Gaopeijia maritima]|uniref:DUF4287 domain-containing protein n=1 Tax=Gaopeijia maritima TaxID=3119007 RepID=A0ABU9ECZ5_9BACT
MARSADDQVRTMIANLKEKTGRTIEEWMAVLAGREGEKHGALVASLKGDHGVTHGFANLIVHTFRDGGVAPAASPGASTPPADLVAAQYEGKEHLRPIHDRLLDAVTAFGDDVEVAPKKSYVSLRRTRQFALVQPSTRTRVDLGLRLDGVEPAGRLESSGSFNSMVSHRVRLNGVEDVDDEVLQWLEAAYRDA